MHRIHMLLRFLLHVPLFFRKCVLNYIMTSGESHHTLAEFFFFFGGEAQLAYISV